MTKRLTDLEGMEVSLVPAGAIRKKFYLTKSDDQNITVGGEAMPDIQKIIEQVIKEDLKDAVKVEEVLKEAKMTDQAQACVKGALKLLNAAKAEMPEDVQKVLPKLAAMLGYGYPEPKEAACAPKYPTKKEDGSYDLTDVPAEVAQPIEQLWKDNVDMKGKVEAVTKERDEFKGKFEKEIDDRETKEFVAKAAEFKHIGSKPEELGPVLKTLSKTDKAGYEKMLATLKAADEVAAKGGLFTETGTGGQGSTPSDAMGKLQAKAEVVRKENPSMTKEAAFTKAVTDNPELYAEYKDELSKKK